MEYCTACLSAWSQAGTARVTIDLTVFHKLFRPGNCTWEEIQGSKVFSVRTGRFYPPGNILGEHFCLRLSRLQNYSAGGRIMAMKNPSDTIGNRTPALPDCSFATACPVLYYILYSHYNLYYFYFCIIISIVIIIFIKFMKFNIIQVYLRIWPNILSEPSVP